MNISKRLGPALLAAAAALAASAPASAATLVFDFGANGGGLNTSTSPDTYSLTNGGLTVNVRAYNGLSGLLNRVSFNSQADVTHASAGLGVAGNGSGQVNDFGLLSGGEGLLLVFNQSVNLTRAVFGAFGSGDDVGFEFGSPIVAGETLDALSAPGGTWSGSYTGTQFFFAANSLVGTDSFRLNRVAVDIGAVPEPATWAMMLLGFGFVGGAMRSVKRRQKFNVTYA